MRFALLIAIGLWQGQVVETRVLGTAALTTLSYGNQYKLEFTAFERKTSKDKSFELIIDLDSGSHPSTFESVAVSLKDLPQLRKNLHKLGAVQKRKGHASFRLGTVEFAAGIEEPIAWINKRQDIFYMPPWAQTLAEVQKLHQVLERAAKKK